jgi:hypothetical protein
MEAEVKKRVYLKEKMEDISVVQEKVRHLICGISSTQL